MRLVYSHILPMLELAKTAIRFFCLIFSFLWYVTFEKVYKSRNRILRVGLKLPDIIYRCNVKAQNDARAPEPDYSFSESCRESRNMIVRIHALVYDANSARQGMLGVTV